MSSRRFLSRQLRQLSIILFLIVIGFISCSPANSTEDDWESTLDENEKLALDAIKYLHRQLDDDQDGNINLDESNEFLREELKYERDYEKRQKVFHRNNDNQVTVKELWGTWVKSEVHNWTVDQTIEWLSVFVGLPQYTPIFLENSINGTFLPRLAVNHQQFLPNFLGIKDMIHKQKVSLKAQDVVLFGPPKEYTNYVKDVILTSLLVIAIGICWNVSVRYKSSQRELSKIIKDMEGLAKAEKELQDLQNVMEKNKVEREELSRQIEKSMSQKSFSELELPDDQVREEISRLRSEVEVLRSELQRAEVELQDKCWVPPPALQHWLQLTYELELKTYNKKKQSAERQLRQAKDACDKLKKKRSSLMGAFVSTHGKSIDDVDKAILEAKGSLTEITHELQERMHRWKQIEILANCPIMNNPGLHYLETVLRGYGKASSYGGPGSVISNSQDDIDDDAASSIYCPSAVHKLVSTSTFMMFPAGHPNSVPSTSTSLPPIASSRRSSNQPLSTISSLMGYSGGGGGGVGGGGACNGNNMFPTSSAATLTLLENLSSLSVSSKDRESKSSSYTSTSPQSSTFLPTFQLCQTFQRSYGTKDNFLGDEVSSPSTESEDTVSAPPASTSLHQSMPRSKSLASMQTMRSGVGRELVTRDSSTGDEDNMPGEASEMVARDRRVTFGIRPENRNVGENFPFGENNGLERKQDTGKSPLTLQSYNVSEGDHEEELKRDTFSSTEKPDLIKLSSYPPSQNREEINIEKMEIVEKGTMTENQELESEDMESREETTTCGVNGNEAKASSHSINEDSMKETNTEHDVSSVNGLNVNGSLPRKVKLSTKVGVLRSISRLVSQSSESLFQKHSKATTTHAMQSEQGDPRSLTSVTESPSQNGEVKSHLETNSQASVSLVTQKRKTKFFSSFRTKKKLLSSPSQHFQTMESASENVEVEKSGK